MTLLERLLNKEDIRVTVMNEGGPGRKTLYLGI